MRKKIIIIDDDPEDIEIMKESVLTLEVGCECETFLDACEALDYLNSSAVPDLIVIDLNMPKMDGGECLREIRKVAKLHSVLVAIYSSAVAPKESLAMIKESRAVFFQKPSSYDDLNKMFKQLLTT